MPDYSTLSPSEVNALVAERWFGPKPEDGTVYLDDTPGWTWYIVAGQGLFWHPDDFCSDPVAGDRLEQRMVEHGLIVISERWIDRTHCAVGYADRNRAPFAHARDPERGVALSLCALRAWDALHGETGGEDGN